MGLDQRLRRPRSFSDQVQRLYFYRRLAQSVGNAPPGLDADFRMWGGGYWFQNTRLSYWSMLYSGDYDLMRPLFSMFLNSLPLARERPRIYCNHAGAFYPETQCFWGTYHDSNYGRDREGRDNGWTL